MSAFDSEPMQDPYTVPERCTRCKKPFEECYPATLGVVDFHTPSGTHGEWETGRSFICARCIIDVAEVLCPHIAVKPGWIAEKDQVLANIDAWDRKRKGTG